jgi:hypothetical protein
MNQEKFNDINYLIDLKRETRVLNRLVPVLFRVFRPPKMGAGRHRQAFPTAAPSPLPQFVPPLSP